MTATAEHIALNKTIMRAPGGLPEILTVVVGAESGEVIDEGLPWCNLVNCCSALQRIAKLSPPPPPGSRSLRQPQPRGARDKRLDLLLRRTATLLQPQQSNQSAQPRQISGIIWSAAKLGLASQQADEKVLTAALAALAATRPASAFKPQEISNIFWALGKMQQQQQQQQRLTGAAVPAAALETLAQAVAPQVLSFTTQGLANTLWGLGIVLASQGGGGNATDDCQEPAT